MLLLFIIGEQIAALQIITITVVNYLRGHWDHGLNKVLLDSWKCVGLVTVVPATLSPFSYNSD